MLDRLEAWIGEHDDPCEFELRIDGLDWAGRDLRVQLSPASGDGSRERGWTIVCREVYDVQIRDRSGPFELLFEDCPAVRQFVDLQVELTFHGTTAEPGALAWRLREAHRFVTYPWIDFEQYLNSQLGVEDLLAGGYGSLASGPEFVVRALKRVLDEAGISAGLGRPQPRKSWIDGAWRVTPRGLHGLAIGRSVIVAASFEEVERVDGA